MYLLWLLRLLRLSPLGTEVLSYQTNCHAYNSGLLAYPSPETIIKNNLSRKAELVGENVSCHASNVVTSVPKRDNRSKCSNRSNCSNSSNRSILKLTL